jgi:hypothetical protein
MTTALNAITKQKSLFSFLAFSLHCFDRNEEEEEED